MNWRPAAKEPVLLLTFGLHPTRFRIVHLFLGIGKNPLLGVVLRTLSPAAKERGKEI
jgi:hypothetical protein